MVDTSTCTLITYILTTAKLDATGQRWVASLANYRMFMPLQQPQFYHLPLTFQSNYCVFSYIFVNSTLDFITLCTLVYLYTFIYNLKGVFMHLS